MDQIAFGCQPAATSVENRSTDKTAERNKSADALRTSFERALSVTNSPEHPSPFNDPDEFPFITSFIPSFRGKTPPIDFSGFVNGRCVADDPRFSPPEYSTQLLRRPIQTRQSLNELLGVADEELSAGSPDYAAESQVVPAPVEEDDPLKIPSQLIAAKFEEIKDATLPDGDRSPDEIYAYDLSKSKEYPKEYIACFRFYDIHCLKSTAVRVEGLTENEFFHANYIRVEGSHPMIATQYPMPGKAMEYFWEVFYREGAVVINLTNKNDAKNRYGPDYKPYWPVKFGEITIEPIAAPSIEGDSFFRYRFRMQKKEGDPVEKDIIHFKGWEDQQGAKPEDLIALINFVRPYLAEGQYPIFHCMAGNGRAGTLATLLIASDQIRRGEINRDNLLEKVGEIILECRKYRGSNFVQKPVQLEAVIRACELLL